MDNRWHYFSLAINVIVAAINIIIAVVYGITWVTFITAWVCFIFAHALLCFCNVAHNNWQKYNNAKIKILSDFIDLQQKQISELGAKDEMGKER